MDRVEKRESQESGVARVVFSASYLIVTASQRKRVLVFSASSLVE